MELHGVNMAKNARGLRNFESFSLPTSEPSDSRFLGSLATFLGCWLTSASMRVDFLYSEGQHHESFCTRLKLNKSAHFRFRSYRMLILVLVKT